MQADERLNLCGVLEPYCLLLYKSTLAAMQPGAVLEIHVRDPETLKDLRTILERSEETVLAEMRREDHTCLWVRKGDVRNE